MPLTKAVYRCKGCNEYFSATSEEFTTCQCGKCEVKPNVCSTSYTINKGNYELIESKTFYYESDFFIFDESLNNLYIEIKKTCEELGFYVHEMTEIGENNEKFLSTISISNESFISSHSSELNIISFWCDLSKVYYNPNYESIKERMLKFKKFLGDLKNDNISTKSRSRLIDYAEDNNVSIFKTQIEEYDYTFCF